MNNLMSMNEYINNINNFQYILKKFKNELDNTIGRELIYDEYYDGDDDKPYTYVVTIYGNIIAKETTKLEKCLEKYKKIFDKDELFFDYKSSTIADSKMGILTYYYYCVVKNNKILRAKPAKLLYHTSNPIHREGILKYGLLPTNNKTWSQMLWYKPAVFASKNFENLFLYRG